MSPGRDHRAAGGGAGVSRGAITRRLAEAPA
jgi:hypothetical protein